MSERYETEYIVDNGAIVRTDITRVTNTTGQPQRVLTEADYQKAWDAIRAAAKPAIEHTLKAWNNMRHNRPLMNALGIYRLPGDKPLLHNGKAPR